MEVRSQKSGAGMRGSDPGSAASVIWRGFHGLLNLEAGAENRREGAERRWRPSDSGILTSDSLFGAL
jgi:hypothetical protein